MDSKPLISEVTCSVTIDLSKLEDSASFLLPLFRRLKCEQLVQQFAGGVMVLTEATPSRWGLSEDGPPVRLGNPEAPVLQDGCPDGKGCS